MSRADIHTNSQDPPIGESADPDQPHRLDRLAASPIHRLAIVWLICATMIIGFPLPVSAAQPLDRAAVARGADFNGDGYTDLALTGTDETGAVGISLIRIMYGGHAGLSTQRMQRLTLTDLVAAAATEADEGLLAGSLTSGDFDGDGFTDLVIGIPQLTVENVAGAGGVLLLRGSREGLDDRSGQLLTQATPGLRDAPEEEDGLGSALAAANVGRGPEDDLIIGVRDEDLPSGVYDGGQIHVLYGSTRGVDPTTSQIWRQTSPGIEGRAGDSDNWGQQLTTGNFDGSPYADLAIGNPGDHYRETYEHGAGTVQVLYGSADGLTAVGSQRISAAMPALATRGHVYGFPEAMAAADFDADGRDDLALASIGGPRFDTAGSVTVLYGSPQGITAARAETWSQDSVGIAGTPGESEWFGLGLATGNFGRDTGRRSYADLAVGVGESVDAPESGGVHIIFGGPQGLTGSNSQFWSQSSPGVPGVSEEGDAFGLSLAAGDFGHNPQHGSVDDLAIMSTYEVTDGTDLGCAITVLYGTNGLSAAASQRWTPVDFGLPAKGYGYFPEIIHS